MEDVQKDLISDIMKLSSSSAATICNDNLHIDFLPDEPVLVAKQESLFDIINEKENIINMANRLSSQSTQMINKIEAL
ncbi:unnamed protein product, partial [Rotaria sp. Silwood1]